MLKTYRLRFDETEKTTKFLQALLLLINYLNYQLKSAIICNDCQKSTKIGKKKRYNSGTELWSTVDAPMSTVDIQTSTSMSVYIRKLTLPIRKVDALMSTVDALMSTLLNTVRAKVNAQAPMSMWRC